MKEDFMTHCSFCGKEELLIVGPEVSICYDCVELCADIVEEVKEK